MKGSGKRKLVLQEFTREHHRFTFPNVRCRHASVDGSRLSNDVICFIKMSRFSCSLGMPQICSISVIKCASIMPGRGHRNANASPVATRRPRFIQKNDYYFMTWTVWHAFDTQFCIFWNPKKPWKLEIQQAYPIKYPLKWCLFDFTSQVNKMVPMCQLLWFCLTD